MPDFNKLRNKDELESLYLGKVIVVVEDESDAKLFARLIGPGQGEYIEFQVPHEKGTGSRAVKLSVQTQREKNKRVYGLMDGEASVSYKGGYDKLRECVEPFFEIEGLDGVMFLAEHEAENILINYADVAAYIENDATLGNLGKRSSAEINDQIEEVVERHLWAAMCKYVSYEMHGEKCMDGVLNNTFHNELSSCQLMKLVKSGVVAKGGAWPDFLVRFKLLRSGTEAYFLKLDDASRKKARRRLTDGKAALSKIQSMFNIKATWQGHLVKEVAASSYARIFRDSLFRRTEITT